MNEQKQSLSIPLAIIIAGALIAFGIYWSGRGSGTSILSNNDSLPTMNSVNSIKEIGPEDHVIGDRKAPIVIVVYSDIECPYCKQFHLTLKQLMSTYGTKGQLAWAFRHFPVHENSLKEGEAIECAAEIGGNEAFWKYTDTIFELTKSNNGLDLALLPQIATQIGLDGAKFSACLDSGKYEAKITQHRQDVANAGAEGTPYSVIFAKGERIPLEQGALPLSDMKTIIEAILAE